MKRLILPFFVVLGVFLAPFSAFAQSFSFGNDVIDIKDGGNGNNGFMLNDGSIQYGPTYTVEGSVEEGGDHTYQDIEAIYTGSLELFYRVGVPEASLSSPYFLNGSASFQINFNPVNFGHTYTIGKANLYLEPIVSDNLVVYAYNDNSNFNVIKFLVYFRNYCITDSKTIIPIPEISYRYNMTIQNELYVSDTGMPVPSKIQVVSNVSSYNATFGRTSAPDVNIGDASIIHDAVLSGINGSSISDISVLLNLVKEQDFIAYGQILNSLADLSSSNNQIKMYLMANLPDILTYVRSISSEQLRFNDALYTLLYNYIYATDSDTQMQSEFANQSQALESINNALDVSKPNVDGIVNGADLYLTPDLISVQGDAFSWLNNGFILPILLLTFTIGLLGFVLYGKSG